MAGQFFEVASNLHAIYIIQHGQRPPFSDNIIMGPPKRVLSKNAQGEDMNMFEKSDYLASNFFSWFAKRGQWLIVAGFGAGGDVRGAVDAGAYSGQSSDCKAVWQHGLRQLLHWNPLLVPPLPRRNGGQRLPLRKCTCFGRRRSRSCRGSCGRQGV